MQDLAGKTAVVTGAGSGIGEGIARACAAAGMQVAVADLDLPAAEAVAADIGEGAAAFAVDVSALESVEALRDAVLARFGGVHLVCNNAGVWVGATMDEATMADWDFLIGVNLYGVIHGVKAFLPLLLERGEGHIVNTASMGGLISGPPEGPYCTTKFAIVGLSESMLMEVADKGVGVSVLCPGLVKSRLITRSAELYPEGDHGRPAPQVEEGMEPLEVGGRVLDAVTDGSFYIITHDDYRDIIAMRHDGILDALDQQAARYRSSGGMGNG